MAAKLDAGKVKSFYNEEKKRVTARQGVLAKDKADAERQKKRLADEVKECEKEATKVAKELSGYEIELRKTMTKVDEARGRKREAATELKKHIFTRGELVQELKVKQQQVGTLVRQFEKSEPIFGTLERIEQRCKERKVQGYLGRLIDFVQCRSERLTAAVDLAAKAKLTAIVVDTLETAQAVLKIN